MRIVIATILLLTLLLAARPVQAVPIYLVFKGEVTNSTVAGYDVGQQVHYVFRIDTDADGYYSANHSPSVYVDYSNGEDFADFFLSEYIGGSAITKDLHPSGAYEYHFGYSESMSGEIIGTLFGSNGDPSGNDYIEIHGPGLVTSWREGQGGFDGYNFLQSNSSQQYVLSGLTLVGVSADVPQAVPEPSGLLLGGLGLICMALVIRRFRKA